MSTGGYTMPPMILGGDVGGTKTLLGLFTEAPVRPVLVERFSASTLDFATLEDMVDVFLTERNVPPGQIRAASFGVAGPIFDQVAELTNVPWNVDASAVARRFAFPHVTLLNDLQAMAYSVPVLEPSELEVLQAGRSVDTGNAALIAAGTGLGEALLHRVGGRFIPSPTEGGHADFAARTPEEIALLIELTRTCGRVDYEHVLSGPGLVNIHRFLHPNGCDACGRDADSARLPAAISQAALEGTCPQCVHALDMFVSVYGAEAGNLALRSVASAGLYLGGGIAPKILPALKSTRFIEAFTSKQPMADFLAHVPVRVILNDHAGLIGASVHANRRAAGERSE
jgi:glucokinase